MYGLQEAEENDLRVSVSTMIWAGTDAIVLACSLYSRDDDSFEVQPSLEAVFAEPLVCCAIAL